MSGNSITLETIDELLRFLPLFDAPRRKYVKAWAAVFTIPSSTSLASYTQRAFLSGLIRC